MRLLKVLINIVASLAVFVITAYIILMILDRTIELKKAIIVLVVVFALYMFVLSIIRDW